MAPRFGSAIQTSVAKFGKSSRYERSCLEFAPGLPRFAATRHLPGRMRERSNGTQDSNASRSTHWLTGPKKWSGNTFAATSLITMSSMIATTPALDACTAHAPFAREKTVAPVAGLGSVKLHAGCTSLRPSRKTLPRLQPWLLPPLTTDLSVLLTG